LVAIEFQGFRYGNTFVVYVTLIFWKIKVRGIHVAHARVPLVLAREQTGARGAATGSIVEVREQRSFRRHTV
jgi:hypothetical protein